MLKSETLPTDSLAQKGKSRDASASKNLHNKKSLPLLSPLLSLQSMGICRRRKFSEKENLIRSEVKTSFLSLGKSSILQINRIVNPCAHSLFNWVISSNEHFVFLCFSFCTQIPDNLLYFLVIFIKILQ